MVTVRPTANGLMICSEGGVFFCDYDQAPAILREIFRNTGADHADN